MIMGSGHMQAMNEVLRNNRELLRQKVRYFKNGRDYFKARKRYLKIGGDNFNYKKADKELLRQIRITYQKKRKRELILHTAIIFFAAFTLLLALTYPVFKNPSYESTAETSYETIIRKNGKNLTKQEREFILLIRDGRDWIASGNYHFAARQFYKAHLLLPNDTTTLKHLYTSYLYLCETENIHCEESETMKEYLTRNK